VSKKEVIHPSVAVVFHGRIAAGIQNHDMEVVPLGYH